jgi:selenide, water dikinase
MSIRKLTACVKAGGCASKLSPKVLDRVLATVPRAANSSVLVGYDTSDDAGVYQITPEIGLVQTVDFFTPIVDDPYTYGAIAAANALSDVYAMGGRPISALSILAWPASGDLDDLEAILRGGADKIHEAGAVVLGGHSVSDEELKFGYAVTGTVHPFCIKANSGARAGDALVFTKRIGTGVISTALKKEIARESDVNASIESMLKLNRTACEAMLAFEVHGCTDVSGFGLLGHAREMAMASGVTLELDFAKVQFLPGAVEYAQAGAISGGLRNNRDFVEPFVESDGRVDDLLFDPQTSGGLLISLPDSDADLLIAKYPAAYRIGRVIPQSRKALKIV